MKFYDVVFGDSTVEDPEIIKIINHPSMQRLKRIWISAYGYLYDLKRNSTRYEHSLGVYLLLRASRASKEEQIAGLIHDISHTALSHVSTYAFHGKYTGAEFHDLKQKEFLDSSGLSKLLIKLGYDPDKLLHEKDFTLLDNELPDICADRIDYALRDGLHLQILSKQQVNQILKSIKVFNREFVFTDTASAFTYSHNFYLLNLMFYGSAVEAYFNNDFANLVKYAVKANVLKEKDWFTDDVYLTDKLRKSKNSVIRKWLGKYNNKMIIFEDTIAPDYIYPKKLRVVDPKVLTNNKLKRLSDLSSSYKDLITEYNRTHKNHELPIRIVHRSI